MPQTHYLQKFTSLKNQFTSVGHNYRSIDEYGFTTSTEPDLLITGLTHGNETIGLQVINLFLEKILKENKHPSYSFAVLLNNVKAFEKNVRFIDKDLNRSFHASEALPKNLETNKPAKVITANKGYEYHRALEIERIILDLKPKFIIDLHQTVEPTLSPFFVLPEDFSLILSAHAMNANWPIVAFDSAGFSKDGRTLMEFSLSQKIPSFVIEISQNGYDQSLALEMCDRLFYLNVDGMTASKHQFDIEYNKITHSLTKDLIGVELIPGFSNLQKVVEGELLGFSTSGDEYFAPASGLMIFPKYGRLAENSQELGLIATPKKISKNLS
jgi:hypothetical protein